MNILYLDHNIYISARDDDNLKSYLKKLKNKNIQCVYSPAHIEEVYRVKVDTQSPNRNKMDELMNIISEITNNQEILPTTSKAKMEIRTESPQECYKKVAAIDTTKFVEANSRTCFSIDSSHYKNVINNDPNENFISTLDEKEIWEHNSVKNLVDDICNNILEEIFRYNFSSDIVFLKGLGFDKFLPNDFSLQKNQYSVYKNHHNQLEYAIETLFRVLNYNGYNAEKEVQTTISGIHDVTHAIYATEADWLLSLDKRFCKKCKAVYYYIGADTQVIHCKNGQIISEIEDVIRNRQ